MGRVTTEEKTRENRIRRRAQARGWELVKVIFPTGRCWMVVDPEDRKILSGLVLLTIDEVDMYVGAEQGRSYRGQRRT